ncbi:hypothetical protein PISMIDRAFT_680751 [Pisolithus microcarpus 441]|uniref:Uncharacterized protein n=1 Tax=Pisolithus microcarpus 441 TaxID=765257 RepID=A0A0C9ZQN5_9AGAM|nr:hypothetical protein PISMIDRAFT_680751 [Pisolithus microcarpus 441]
MSVGNSWSYWQNGHGREHTESFDGYSGVLAAVQQGWGLTPVESLQPDFLMPFVSKNATDLSFQRSHLTDSAERNGNRTNMAETNMSKIPPPSE